MTTRILVVDDTPAIRRSLRFYIESETDWEICGEAENGKVAIERVQELKPDVVILDLSMPVLNGVEAALQIAREAPSAKCSFFRHTVTSSTCRSRNAVEASA